MSKTRSYYRRIGFNQNGDMTAHLKAPKPKMNEREFRFRYRDNLVDESLAQMNEFAKLAEARGAKVFFSHPPLPREVFEQSREGLDQLEATIQTRLEMPKLERMEEMTFPVSDFFDTWYHLAGTGVEKRSTLLAERMARQGRQLGNAAPGTAAR